MVSGTWRSATSLAVDVQSDPRFNQPRVAPLGRKEPPTTLTLREAPVALLCLVHLGVACAVAIFSRTRCVDQRTIDHGSAFWKRAHGRKRGDNGGQDLQALIVGFSQVTKPKKQLLQKVNKKRGRETRFLSSINRWCN